MRLGREWIGLALVVLAIVRAGLLVGHDPLMGYANQYDMLRTSACIGLYPALDDPTAATPAAPVAAYKAGGPRSGLCYFSTEVMVDAALVHLARLVDKESALIRLQWIGCAKLALFAFAALLVAWALHRDPGAALLHGVIVLAILADPAATLWYNSLYTEFGAIWGLYAMIAAACALAQTARARYPMWMLLAAGTAALAFSREQYALLGVALAVAAAPWLWRRSGEMTVVILLFALAACLASNSVAPRPGVVTHVNRADTYLGVVLPASARPQRALAVLGLPDRCESMIGASWYLQRGENLQQACPEVFELSSLAFLRFLRAEPDLLGRALARGLPALQALAPSYLGVLEGKPRASRLDLPWYAASPLAALADAMPGRVFALLVLAAIFAAPAAALAAIAWARPSRMQPCTGLLLAILLGGTVLYGVLTTLFGDGLSEAARHFIPGALAMYALVIAAIAGVPSVAARWIVAPKERALEMVAAVAAIAIAWVSIAGMARWAETQPLAIGTLDVPAGREVKPGTLAIRGWALDPSGVESVQVEIGPLKRDAQTGIPSPALRAALPGYPDSAQGNFALDLTAEDLAKAGAPEPLWLRVTARGRGGSVTEIDRRRLELKP